MKVILGVSIEVCHWFLLVREFVLTNNRNFGLFRDLNPGALASKARIISRTIPPIMLWVRIHPVNSKNESQKYSKILNIYNTIMKIIPTYNRYSISLSDAGLMPGTIPTRECEQIGCSIEIIRSYRMLKDCLIDTKNIYSVFIVRWSFKGFDFFYD